MSKAEIKRRILDGGLEANFIGYWKGMLTYIGEDPTREGLQDTPLRILASWEELFGGYKQKPEDVITTFENDSGDEMIILDNIDFTSFCEHHFLPFFGKISIGYIPNKRVIGVSKLARLVEIFARRLQIQERLTGQIADSIMEHLEPQGVIVYCEAQHFCMTGRGVKKRDAVMKTSAIRKIFLTNPEAKSEFLSIIRR